MTKAATTIAMLATLVFTTGALQAPTTAAAAEEGKRIRASWYGPRFHLRRTASGEIFNQFRLTAAHRTLGFGTIVEVCRGKWCVVVKINDRGPFVKDRDLDLSYGAALRLNLVGKGVALVTYRIIARPS